MEIINNEKIEVKNGASKLKNFVETLNNLNPKEFHKWPFSVLTFIGVLLSIVILAIGYFVIISSSIEDWDNESVKEEKLKKDYDEKIKQSENLDLYKKQLQDICL